MEEDTSFLKDSTLPVSRAPRFFCRQLLWNICLLGLGIPFAPEFEGRFEDLTQLEPTEEKKQQTRRKSQDLRHAVKVVGRTLRKTGNGYHSGTSHRALHAAYLRLIDESRLLSLRQDRGFQRVHRKWHLPFICKVVYWGGSPLSLLIYRAVVRGS